jgi:chemotaxis protein CheD
LSNLEVITINIGEIRISRKPVIFKTILGSCIGVTCFDSETKIGGICHILLPYSNGSMKNPGKFADTAISELLRRLTDMGCKVENLTVKMAGGAQLFSDLNNGNKQIGTQNIEAIKKILKENKIPIFSKDFGGKLGRTLTFNTETGEVKIVKSGIKDKFI